MQDWVEAAVGDALRGKSPADEVLLHLLELDEDSAQAAHVCWAAQRIARKASGNRAQIYAQIGVDMLPCPMDCGFCTLAHCNASDEVLARSKEQLIVPTRQIVDYARVFDNANVHLISLMATAALPFERYLAIVAAVRDAVHDDQVIMINAGDMSLEQLQRLKEAGAQMAYHAHRLGEGEITRIPSERRLQTIGNIKEAGLGLMTAVEPVHTVTSAAQILDRMHEVALQRPYCSGVGGLHAVPGTAMQDAKPVSRRRLRLLASVMRLLVGESIPFGTGGANVLWADAGTNPRGRDLACDPDFLRRDVARLRKELAGEGWEVPVRPIYGQ